MRSFIEHSLDRLDYLAAIPDRAWSDSGMRVQTDQGMGSPNRFQPLPQAALLEQAARERPIVLHGIGMSICSAEFFDEEYARNLIDWAMRFDSPWISDHLSFTRVGTGHEVNAAIPLAVPYDNEALALLIPRIQFIAERWPRPFLLENNVYYLRYAGENFTEEEFLNELARCSGCGVLLDLHNLYTNAVNHKFSARDYLANLNLANVIEIHIAGGLPMMGYHTDSHTGPVLEPVWQLLEDTVAHAPNLRGVTFEFHETSYGMLGESGILEQVERAREIVNAHATRPKMSPDMSKEIASDVDAVVSAGAR